MVQYGDTDTVKAMLRPDEMTSYGSDIDAGLTAIQAAVTLAIDDATGRTFGVPAAETSELYWTDGQVGTLILTRPATAITSITYGGTVSGTTMTGGTTVLASELVYPIRDRSGRVYALRAATGGWYGGPVVVTATFDDGTYDPDTADHVPDDITYVANYLIGETFKKEQASPAGYLGPEGVVPIRDVWSDPLVKRVLSKYRGSALVV